jgi:glycosyltransferase involved in cell wall biosynthesis
MGKPRRQEERGKFGWANICINIFNLCRFVRLIIRARPEVVHLPLAQNPGAFLRDSLFVLLAKLFGRHVIIHFHGSGFAEFYDRQTLWYRCYIKGIFRLVDHLVVLAYRLRSQFQGLVSSDRISVLYNGIDTSLFEQGRMDLGNQSTREVRVLFVGNISRVKGAVDLVHAVPEVLSRSRYPTHFLFVGAPINEERTITFLHNAHGGFKEIQQFIQQNCLQEFVEFKGELYGSAITKAFFNADILVLPSYSEGFSIVILEAMAAGLPIVTTPVGALPEVLEEGVHCLFVQPGDLNALADRLVTLINNPMLRSQMGSENRRKVKAEFNADTFTQGLAAIWTRVLKWDAKE